MLTIPGNIVTNSPLARDAVFNTASSGHIPARVLFFNNSANETLQNLQFSIESPAITAVAEDVSLVAQGDTVDVEGEEETFEVRTIEKSSAGLKYFELVYAK